MKANNEWIKYLAIALGLVIAIGVISMIVNGGVLMMQSLGLFKDNLQLGEDSPGYFNQEYSDKLENISINFKVGNLRVQSGEKFVVEGSNLSPGLTVKVNNGTLKIEDQGSYNFLGNLFNRNKNTTLAITIPEGMALNRVELEMGAGRGEIIGISAKEFDIKQGAGELRASNIQAESGKLSGGAGAVNFENVKLNNFDIDAGVGLVDIQGNLTGNLDINAGVGQIILDIAGDPQNYYIDVNTGLGPITIDGLNVDENGTGSKNAPNKLKIDGGVGPVEINFTPQI